MEYNVAQCLVWLTSHSSLLKQLINQALTDKKVSSQLITALYLYHNPKKIKDNVSDCLRRIKVQVGQLNLEQAFCKLIEQIDQKLQGKASLLLSHKQLKDKRLGQSLILEVQKDASIEMEEKQVRVKSRLLLKGRCGMRLQIKNYNLLDLQIFNQIMKDFPIQDLDSSLKSRKASVLQRIKSLVMKNRTPLKLLLQAAVIKDGHKLLFVRRFNTGYRISKSLFEQGEKFQSEENMKMELAIYSNQISTEKDQ